MVSEERQQQEKESSFPQIPILYWLLFAVFIAGLYIFVLINLDASRSRVQEFRFTSDSHVMNLASTENSFKKPSPFGKPAPGQRAVAKQGSGKKSPQRTS
jgi:hypothetical protein